MGNIDSLDIFSLTSILKKEAKLLESFSQLGLSTAQIKDLIGLDASSAKTSSSDFGIDIRDSAILWLNDLETDSKYSYWAKDLQEILRPTYPGMMRPIARNFYNLVFIIDPAKDECKRLISTAESFYLNDIPIRIGFVFVTNDQKETDGFKEANVALFRAYNYIVQSQGRDKALSFITDVYSKSPKNMDVTADLVVKSFKRKFPKETNLDDVFGVDSDYDEGRLLTMDYYRKIGLKQLPMVVLNGYLLKESEIEDDTFEESVINKVMAFTTEIQMSVYKGIINDRTVLLDWFMNKETIMPRLNPRILATASHRVYLDSTIKSSDFSYLVNDDLGTEGLTLLTVCDPDTAKGREFLYEALGFFESSKVGARLALVVQQSDNGDSILKRAIFWALERFQTDKKKQATFIKRLLRENTFNQIKFKQTPISQLDFVLKDFSDINDIDTAINSFDLDSLVSQHREFLQVNTPFKQTSSMGLVANGWVLGPFDEDETFIDNDFSLLENYILKIGLTQIKTLVNKQWSIVPNAAPDLIVKISSIIGRHVAMSPETSSASSSTSSSSVSEDKRHKIPTFTQAFIRINPTRVDLPFFDLVAIIDPLSRASQKLSTILKVLTQITNVNLVIYFNCKDKLSAPPLKSFYRYVLEADVRFDNQNEMVKPLAYFQNMPQTPVLTMNIQVPEGWMVEAVNSPFDLDNICLKDVPKGVYGEYELEHLIIEGHAYDVQSNQSPRGLQFNLGTRADMMMYDTIVMANLGYFQLKASPGMWILHLREGKSKDIYEIVSHENTDSQSKRSATIFIVIDSFESKVIRVKVSKKSDKLNENLLDDDKDSAEQQQQQQAEKENSIWDNFGFGSSTESPNKGADVLSTDQSQENVLNIFSVASGHLYERLLRIMMLTVLKNTQAKVKFWFLKNYLSPQFTKFLPAYAREYNFTYELVQYKWPRWLHHESEKQRIIWGYKILFLDVLFPLNVEKIIYVDADQIVRADLTELRDLDLKGAPYGYTPFCDSRKEMDGYRFWKSGYWSMHLGHRKYHISALYVVDLKKFRKIAAGDRLRGQYQGLSQDPNSLSNLDQDLPNNMIHQVNIFSLPQEWLYCDTWCSPDTLSKAKTIDLCNNPQTKEPKLSAAVRIAPEWKDLDTEIKTFISKWQASEHQTYDVVPDKKPTEKSHDKEDL
jgi:UDP-glucose:glycoprotein glucosyltransferase